MSLSATAAVSHCCHVTFGAAATKPQWLCAAFGAWKIKFRERCQQKAEKNLQHSLSTGKYTFMMSVMPSLSSSQPDWVSTGTPGVKSLSLYDFLLSSHVLETETRRYNNTHREQRWCKQCYFKKGIRVIGDEAHTLSECVRAASFRNNISASIPACFHEVPIEARAQSS